jgi:hypothetical protein
MLLIREYEFDIRKSTQPAAIVREMATTEHGGLGTDKKVGQNGAMLTFGCSPTPKINPCPPCSLKIQFHPPEQSKLPIDSFTDSSAGSQFSVSHRAHRKVIFVDPLIERFATTHVMFVSGIHPCNDHRSIYENHGRVRRNNSVPEILPSHLPACSKMCFCAAVGGFAFFAISTWPLPSTDHSITVSGPIPAFFAIFAGMFAFPLEMTVLVGMLTRGYGRSSCGSISGRAATQKGSAESGVQMESSVKTPKNFQISNTNGRRRLAVGLWSLRFGVGSFVGIWSLVFGI